MIIEVMLYLLYTCACLSQFIGRALEITVWDYDKVGSSEFIGEVGIQSNLLNKINSVYIDDICVNFFCCGLLSFFTAFLASYLVNFFAFQQMIC